MVHTRVSRTRDTTRGASRDPARAPVGKHTDTERHVQPYGWGNVRPCAPDLVWSTTTDGFSGDAVTCGFKAPAGPTRVRTGLWRGMA